MRGGAREYQRDDGQARAQWCTPARRADNLWLHVLTPTAETHRESTSWTQDDLTADAVNQSARD
ncbi:hypothetical protein BN2476_130092 [Paraburkholderia piptadeniae]|uniref:Uncharacterized protein n=1 Tax=Paraburkholderia piptadeniae TaxID=1701573 RepID=A0A1N7RRL7_9BURK|nr:hypothetical protein BN2476_130092 [Paraburkholderia piptadeniae]